MRHRREIIQLSVIVFILVLIQTVSAEQSHSIDIIGVAFDHNQITLRIIPSGVEVLDEAVKDAINIWNNALREFASLYGYDYLSRIELKVVNETSDIFVRYIDELGNACGEAMLSYTFDKRIQKVEIKISRKCVDLNHNLALTVAEHEIGHALGLGHTGYEEDLMYNRLRGFRKPSTLDLYALSVIYEWIKDGSFHPPEVTKVELPKSISYAYLPMEEERVTIRFWMKSELGESLLTERVADRGQLVTYVADEIREYRNETRLVFRGWYRGDELITTSPTISINATSNADYYAYYDVEYHVDVNLGYERISKWVERGSELRVEADEVKEFSNNTRLVFEKWSGDFEGKDRFVKVKVYEPIKASAMWRRQYKVYIISEPQAISEIIGDGWYDEGSKAMIKVLEPIVLLNDGESKAVVGEVFADYELKNFKDLRFENVSEVSLNVSSPILVVVRWRFYHHVLISSNYIKPIITDKWVLDGKFVECEVPREFRWDNGTMVRFQRWIGDETSDLNHIKFQVKRPVRVKAEWRIFYLVRYNSTYQVMTNLTAPSSWVEKGSSIYLNASPTIRSLGEGVRAVFQGWRGTLSQTSPYLMIDGVDRPLDLRAEWKKQYLLSIRAPDEAGISDEIWIDSGASYEVYAPPTILLSNNTRLVFTGWTGYECGDPLCNITSISKPINLEAGYRFEWLAKIHVMGYDGEPVKEVDVILRCGDDSVRVASDSTTWIYECNWLVENATWKGFDVSPKQSLYIEKGAQEISIPVRVFKAGFRVTDYLGFPVKDAEVIVSLMNGTVLYEGKTAENGEVWNIGPLPPCDLRVEVRYLWFNSSKTFNIGNSRPIMVMVPISLTTIYISVGITSLLTALMMFTAYRRRRETLKQEYREYYEIPPAYPPPPSPPVAEEEGEAGEHVVVSVEDVLKEIEDEELRKLLKERRKRS